MRKGSKTNSARALRRRMTDAERRIWYFLRGRHLLGFKFRRQHPVGPYVVDFVCLEHKLIIELDGSQHADDLNDITREAFLRNRGYRVLRFWNNEALKHTAAVCESILREMSVNPARAGCEGQAEGC